VSTAPARADEIARAIYGNHPLARTALRVQIERNIPPDDKTSPAGELIDFMLEHALRDHTPVIGRGNGNRVREPGEDVDEAEHPSGALPSPGLLSLGELATLPLPVWRIYGLLTGITLLWAGPGSYKTALAIAWAAAVAAGLPWCGRTVQKGAVLFIVGEGALRAFYNRVYVAAVAMGIPPEAVNDLPIYATTGPVNLGQWDGVQVQKLIEDGCRVADKHGPIGFMAIDTVSRNVPGEENSQEVMQGFVGTCDELRRRLGCDILPVHHGNADGGRERGSSVLGGAVDGNLHLVPGPPDAEGRVPLSLYGLKLKEAASGPGRDPIERLVATRTVILGPDGAPLRDEMGFTRTSMVISQAGPEDTTAEEASDQTLLEAIGTGVSASKLCATLGRGKGSVLQDLARLQTGGKVRQTGSGKASRWIHV